MKSRKESRLRPVRGAIAGIALAGVVLACMESPLAPTLSPRNPADVTDTWVLFLGNSHTQVNNVPQLVVDIAAQAGETSLRADVIAFGGAALEDHWTMGTAQFALARYPWSYVVMQQGPSSLPESQVHLRTWTERFAPLIRDAKGEPILYQIWPSTSRRIDAANALTSYTLAAAAVDGILAPAGDAFTEALDAHPGLQVYSPDGTHGSIFGSYLAALTIASRIVGFDPEDLPPVIPGWPTSPDTVRMLQAAAATALARNPSRP
jgi:hypothetical protein